MKRKSLPYGKQYIDQDDIDAIASTISSPLITTGPKVEEFEEKLCKLTGAKYAVVVANGTAALHAACYAAGIGKGDEVVTTPMTFAASANCVLYCGGTLVFADIDNETWTIDPEEIKEKITSKTKAVIGVDFTGQAVRIDEIRAVCRENNLVFIEDASHSIGTKYKEIPIGGLADLTTFSFHPVKTITTGEGGAILTNNKEYYEKMLMFRSHCITRDLDIMTQNPFEGYNEQVGLGFNYRMTDFQAALGISQLNKLDMFSKRRKEIVKSYDEAFRKFPQLTIQKEIPESDTTRHLYIIRIKPETLKVGRDEIYKVISSEGVGLQVHYIPVYYHPYYQSLGYKKGLCPIAEKLYEEIITIPLFYSMTDKDVAYVIKTIKNVINDYSK